MQTGKRTQTHNTHQNVFLKKHVNLWGFEVSQNSLSIKMIILNDGECTQSMHMIEGRASLEHCQHHDPF